MKKTLRPPFVQDTKDDNWKGNEVVGQKNSKQKYQQVLFLYLDKLIQKFTWRNKARTARRTLKNNIKEELALSDTKPVVKAQ